MPRATEGVRRQSRGRPRRCGQQRRRCPVCRGAARARRLRLRCAARGLALGHRRRGLVGSRWRRRSSGPTATGPRALAAADLVVDGVLGIGGRPGLPDAAKAWVDAIPDAAYVVAVDLPSGQDPAGRESRRGRGLRRRDGDLRGGQAGAPAARERGRRRPAHHHRHRAHPRGRPRRGAARLRRRAGPLAGARCRGRQVLARGAGRRGRGRGLHRRRPAVLHRCGRRRSRHAALRRHPHADRPAARSRPRGGPRRGPGAGVGRRPGSRHPLAGQGRQGPARRRPRSARLRPAGAGGRRRPRPRRRTARRADPADPPRRRARPPPHEADRRRGHSRGGAGRPGRARQAGRGPHRRHRPAQGRDDPRRPALRCRPAGALAERRPALARHGRCRRRAGRGLWRAARLRADARSTPAASAPWCTGSPPTWPTREARSARWLWRTPYRVLWPTCSLADQRVRERLDDDEHRHHQHPSPGPAGAARVCPGRPVRHQQQRRRAQAAGRRAPR